MSRLAEVRLRRGLGAVGLVAVVHQVEIRLQNRPFGEPLVELQRPDRLLQLAVQRLLGALVREEQVADDLHLQSAECWRRIRCRRCRRSGPARGPGRVDRPRGGRRSVGPRWRSSPTTVPARSARGVPRAAARSGYRSTARARCRRAPGRLRSAAAPRRGAGRPAEPGPHDPPGLPSPGRRRRAPAPARARQRRRRPPAPGSPAPAARHRPTGPRARSPAVLARPCAEQAAHREREPRAAIGSHGRWRRGSALLGAPRRPASTAPATGGQRHARACLSRPYTCDYRPRRRSAAARGPKCPTAGPTRHVRAGRCGPHLPW